MKILNPLNFNPRRYTRNPELKQAIEACAPQVLALEKAKATLTAAAAPIREPSETIADTLVQALADGKPLPNDLIAAFSEEATYRAVWLYADTQLQKILGELSNRQQNALTAATVPILAHLDKSMKDTINKLRTNPAAGMDPGQALKAGRGDQWQAAEALIDRYRTIRIAQGILPSRLDPETAHLFGDHPVLYWLANPTELFPTFIDHIRNNGWAKVRSTTESDGRNVRVTAPPWPGKNAGHRVEALWLAATRNAEPWIPNSTQAAKVVKDLLATPRSTGIREAEQRMIRDRIGNPPVGPLMGRAAVEAEGP